MSDETIKTIVVALPPTLLALGTLIVQIRSIKKVEEIHKATNSMKDALVAATEKEALARGKKEGAIDERNRLKDPS